MELKLRPRKWGNSIAIIIPKSVVNENQINANEDTLVEFKKKATAKNSFGMFPRKKWRNAQKIKDEMRKGW